MISVTFYQYVFGVRTMLFALILGGIVSLSFWVNRGDYFGVAYVQLYGPLNSNDVARIVSELRDNKIDFELSGNGSSISVPSDKVYPIRVRLAKRGIPSFEGFQNDHIPEPRWPSEDENRIIRINYLRAIQGELSRCIEQIDDVKLARVQIFQWEISSDLEKRPKASVYLFLHRPLNAHSLNVIRQLVANTVNNSQLLANAVNQMQPANVSIHDHLPLSLL